MNPSRSRVLRELPRVAGRRVLAGLLPAGLFLWGSLAAMPTGPVLGTGQDEWFNMARALQALYERLNPAYFIHPALYYEALASVYGVQRALLKAGGRLAGATYLEYFLGHEADFLNLARRTSAAFGALAVLAAAVLAGELAGPACGLAAGLLLAGCPLLVSYATFIRVDTLSLFLLLLAAWRVVRRHREPTPANLALAAAAIGLAAAANYPGALLLGPLAVLELSREDAGAPGRRLRRAAGACLIAFAVFMALNPYVLIDLPDFLGWFLFQASTVWRTHPHAAPPRLSYYLGVIWAQGLFPAAAAAAGAAAVLDPLPELRGVAGFAVLYLAAFSLSRSQYDRFALPALALLVVAGAAAALRRLEPRLARLSRTARAVIGTGAAAALCAAAVPHLAGPSPRSGDGSRTDGRAEMFGWICEHVPPQAPLIFESGTLPLLQAAFDPGSGGRPFQTGLREAFLKRYPRAPRRVLKAQYIGTEYNYDARLLDGEGTYFLGSSINRAAIEARGAQLPRPKEFYAALDAKASLVYESGGQSERLMLYETRPGARDNVRGRTTP